MENILKQGYLKKARPVAPDSIRPTFCNNFLQYFEPSRWYVFIIRDNLPYLEYYEKEESMFSAQPINRWALRDCFKITYTLARTSKIWTFCIFLPERVIELTADSRDHMLDWSRILERTLQNYGRIKEPNEHIYSDYPVQYTPKRSGLEQEQELEAAAALGASGNSPKSPNQASGIDKAKPQTAAANNEDDYADYYEDCQFAKKIKGASSDVPSSASSSDLEGAVAGPSTNLPETAGFKKKFDSELKSPGDADDENSEPDTSEDDFVTKDFWLRHKKAPELPSKDRSKATSVFVSRRDTVNFDTPRSAFSLSVPPLPSRTSKSFMDKGFPSFISSSDLNLDTPPVPPARKKRDKKTAELNNSANQNGETISISKSTRSSNIHNVDESLDDGYECVVDMRKLPPKPECATIEPWVASLDNSDGKASTLKEKEVDLFVDLPPADSITGQKVMNGETCAKSVDHRYDSQSSRESRSSVNSVSSQNSGSNHVSLISVRGKDRISVEENLYSGFPFSESSDNTVSDQMRNGFDLEDNQDSIGDVRNTSKPSATVSVNKDNNHNVYDNFLADPFQNAKDDKSEMYDLAQPLKPKREEAIYDFGGAGKSRSKSVDKLVEPVTTADIPSSHSHSTALVSTKKFSDSESIYSFPKSAKPVAGLSTEEILGPSVPPPRGSSADSETQTSSLYALPTKGPLAAKSNDKVAPSQDLFSVSSKQRPANLRSSRSPTDTVLVQRPLPSLPEKRKGESGDCLGVLSQSEKASSPSHDGFLFNFVQDTRLKSEETELLPQEDSVYEDATGRNNPPVPPRRSLKGRSGAGANRSVSVYIPGKTNRDISTRLQTQSTNESQDDSAVPRNSHGITRQLSLTERQQITCRQSSSAFVVVPLKQSQVELLREEKLQHGVELSISNKSSQGLVFVEAYSGIWVAGWDMKKFPRLTDKVHIGDQVLEVEGIRITSVQHALKVLKMTRAERVVLVVKRLPYAHLLALRRNVGKQNLGFTREAGTAELSYVDPSGLAAASGLPKKATAIDGSGNCNWMLTEINCRPLNLTLKGNEIEHLLNAVGKDITLVVQPADFIKAIKKQLKKLKNYKDYLAL